MTEGYLAYELTDACRASVLRRFPPKYKRVVCTHITYQFDVPEDTPLPRRPKSVVVVGCADDYKGVQALVVEVNGSTQRPDGGTFHITLSLAAGRSPVESNDVVARGWKRLDAPFKLEVEPSWIPA